MNEREAHQREPLPERVERQLREFGSPIFGLANADRHPWGGGGSGPNGLGQRVHYRTTPDSYLAVLTHEHSAEPWERHKVYWVLSAPDADLVFPLTITVEQSEMTWHIADGTTVSARVLSTPTRWVAASQIGDRFVEVEAFGVPPTPLTLRALDVNDVDVAWRRTSESS